MYVIHGIIVYIYIYIYYTYTCNITTSWRPLFRWGPYQNISYIFWDPPWNVKFVAERPPGVLLVGKVCKLPSFPRPPQQHLENVAYYTFWVCAPFLKTVVMIWSCTVYFYKYYNVHWVCPSHFSQIAVGRGIREFISKLVGWLRNLDHLLIDLLDIVVWLNRWSAIYFMFRHVQVARLREP